MLLGLEIVYAYHCYTECHLQRFETVINYNF
jgi:hypothetical protein